jgi:hypothetical protein
MPTYYFIYSIIILIAFFLLIRYFILRKKSLAMLLFINASKAENQGNYLQAVSGYENALAEVKKSKFHGHLKIIIIEKLKVLQTVRTYESNLGFIRQDDSWINQG